MKGITQWKPAALAANRKGKTMKKKAKKNPSAATVRSRAAAIGRRMIAGMDVKKAAMNAIIGAPGPLVAQFAAKKIGDGKSWTDPSFGIGNYAAAVGGAFAAGLLGNMIAPGKGTIMLEHGLAVTLNKAIQDQIIAKSETLSEYLHGPGMEPSILDRLQKLRARRAAAQRIPGAVGYRLAQRLNPPAADTLGPTNRDEYGNPLVAMSGPLVQRGSLGGPLVQRGSLGFVDNEKYSEVF